MQDASTLTLINPDGSEVAKVDPRLMTPENIAAAQNGASSVEEVYRRLGEMSEASLPARERVPLLGVPAAEPVRPGAPAQPSRPSRATDSVSEPTKKAVFEIPNYGPMEVLYHDVQAGDNFVVLISDIRFPGTRSFPRHSPAATLGLVIESLDKIYAVKTTGYQFYSGNQELCVLQVVKEGSYSQYQRSLSPVPSPRLSVSEFGHDGSETGDGSEAQMF